MKVALVHDWLVDYRGGERVLEAIMQLFPEAPIFTLFYDPDAFPAHWRTRQVIVPHWLKPLRKLRKALLPFLPSVIESWNFEAYDLVISTSSCVAKGIVTGPQTTHVSYVHSPMRYIWDQKQHYLADLPRIPGLRAAIHMLSNYLRIWDVTSSIRVDTMIANSNFIAQRIAKFYGRSAQVIAPPVEIEPFLRLQRPPQPRECKYWLAAGAFVPYKRFDLAIAAANKLKQPLVIAGNGPLFRELERQCGPTVKLVHRPDRMQWYELFKDAKGFLFPALEDFGITAVEALAAGVPVIAYRGGGALDFVSEGVNGIFFDHQTEQSLITAMNRYEAINFNTDKIRESAKTYSHDSFITQFSQLLPQGIRHA